MDDGSLPAGWDLWDHEPGSRLILAYRPDIFDGSRHPPACLPTIYVREGRKDLRRAGPQPAAGSSGQWTVTLFLEPEVSTRLAACESMDDATEAAIDQATAFVNGEIDLRELYQRPREEYLSTLETMIGRG